MEGGAKECAVAENYRQNGLTDSPLREKSLASQGGVFKIAYQGDRM